MPPFTFQHAYEAVLGVAILFGSRVLNGINGRMSDHEREAASAAKERADMRERQAKTEAHYEDVAGRLARIEGKLDRVLNGRSR